MSNRLVLFIQSLTRKCAKHERRVQIVWLVSAHHMRGHDRAGQEQLQVTQVGQLGMRAQTPRPSSAASTGCTSNAVHKNAGLRREIIVDHMLQYGQVNTTRSQICHNQQRRLSRSELIHLNRACRLVERRVDVRASIAHGRKDEKQVFDMVLGRTKNNGLIRLELVHGMGAFPLLRGICIHGLTACWYLDHIAKKKEKRRILIERLDAKEGHPQIRTNFAVRIQAD